jgi:drug/metabolite transporter (DMT)-like permease
MLALAAATAYALATVWQQEAAATIPHAHALQLRLVGELLRRRRWLAGRGVEVVALGLQTLAVDRGSLLVVQPILATGVAIALAVRALRTRRRPDPRTVLTAAAVVLCVTAFLRAGRPTLGRPAGSSAAWGASLASLGVVAGTLVLAARGRAPARRGALLAVAGGCLYACSGGLLKQSTAVFHQGGIEALLASPAPWGFLLVGMLGTLLVQSAFQVADLPASVSALTATEPLAGGLVGVLVFGERLTGGTAAHLVVAVSSVALVGTIAAAASVGTNADRTARSSSSHASGGRAPLTARSVRDRQPTTAVRRPRPTRSARSRAHRRRGSRSRSG